VSAKQGALVQTTVVLTGLFYLCAAVFKIVQDVTFAYSPVLCGAVWNRFLEISMESEHLNAINPTTMEPLTFDGVLSRIMNVGV
jgi:hypothetical protein